MAHRRFQIGVLAVLVFAGCANRRVSVAASPSPRQDVITAIKRVERDLGFVETENFHRAGGAEEAYYRCYYTGKLEMPDSYEKLRIKDGDESGCEVDEEKYDVFFYKIEAVAGTDTPVTEALEEASLERLAVVVSHEDFHEDPQIQRLPTRVGEAATTLIGFLTAARYAREEFGGESETYGNLSREAGLYERKAGIVNRYHGELKELYAAVRRRKVSRSEALARKEAIYARMQAECEGIQPDPTSFNKCLAANNNAGLAFEVTYTRYFPLLQELYRALGGDIRRVIGALRAAGDLGPGSEEKTVEWLDDRRVSGGE